MVQQPAVWSLLMASSTEPHGDSNDASPQIKLCFRLYSFTYLVFHSPTTMSIFPSHSAIQLARFIFYLVFIYMLLLHVHVTGKNITSVHFLFYTMYSSWHGCILMYDNNWHHLWLLYTSFMPWKFSVIHGISSSNLWYICTYSAQTADSCPRISMSAKFALGCKTAKSLFMGSFFYWYNKLSAYTYNSTRTA